MPFQFPFNWTVTPPWQQVPWGKRAAEAPTRTDEPETKWVCAMCAATHHNIRKQTCRACGEARAPKQPAKAKAAANARPAGPTEAGKGTGKAKQVSVPKHFAKHLSRAGTQPSPDTGGASEGPKKLENVPTERLQTAVEALQSNGLPESAIRPYKDI